MIKTLFYALNISPLYDDEIYKKAYSLIGAERQKRADGYRLRRDKCLSEGCGLLLRHALSENGFTEIPEISFNEHGKPYFADGPCFSLSHCGELALCVLSDAVAGCDIEQVKEYNPGLPGRIMSGGELEFYQNAKSDFERSELFFRAWTLKESLAKAVGKGLSLPFKTLDFDLSQSPARIKTPEFSDFYFSEYDTFPAFKISLCQKDKCDFPALSELSVFELL